MKKDLLKIFIHYGTNNQLKKLNEEVFELIEALGKYQYRFGTKKHVEEEFADVLVLLNQFQEYYELDKKNIKKIMQQKINRQLERMKEGNEE